MIIMQMLDKRHFESWEKTTVTVNRKYYTTVTKRFDASCLIYLTSNNNKYSQETVDVEATVNDTMTR